MTSTTSAEIDLMNFIECCEESGGYGLGVNNVRRKLKDVSVSVTAGIEKFQQRYLSGMKKTAVWQLPDYCSSSSTCRIFPNSNVILREEEPTSILAFVLGLEEYRMHLETLSVKRPSEANGEVVDSSSSIQTANPSSPIMSLSSAIANISEGLVDSASKVLMGSSSLFMNSDEYAVESPVFSHKVSVDLNPRHVKIRFGEKKHVFSCKVYYAAEFEALRRKCGIESGAFLESLSRCIGWRASGGKTKAMFFKTHDDKYVAKQLSTNWGTVEKDHMLEFAPRYFEYMNQTNSSTSPPSALAKIMGFFSVKSKNLETGVIQQLDILIMEHLFSEFDVGLVFDLKGVLDRRKPATASATADQKDEITRDSRVLWDGDWVDGNCKYLYCLESPSKRMLMESLKADTHFLASANIMDYSLLVGVGKEKDELRVGIIDFIGPYTMLKKMETTGKLALRGNATVIPPKKYAERFCQAVNDHFIEVPDKWTCNK
ncbi:UNVERIFIED_CONTAM: hypothetical protein HDU68_012208 [Siphonaria sp. JEL0065]|nr:hypothetical protein HDU68_012208 [Siphonaria sp. JEL0065]